MTVKNFRSAPMITKYDPHYLPSAVAQIQTKCRSAKIKTIENDSGAELPRDRLIDELFAVLRLAKYRSDA